MQIGLNKASDYLTENDMSRITYDVRNSAYDIINKKGNTAYGIGICLERLTNAILDDSHKIFTVSCYNEEYNIFIGEPAVLGKNGVEQVIKLNLTNEDKFKFEDCVNAIKTAITKARI